MADTIQSLPKKLSNSFSTGGGGYTFERHVQAVFLLLLITNGISPGLHQSISKLHFQAKRLGFHADDLVVEAIAPEHARRLLCQIKHIITVTENNETFQEVITAAWNDFADDKFNKRVDKIALITGVLARKSIDALQKLHDQAVAAENANDFLQRIEQRRATNNSVREKLEVMKQCLSVAKGSKLSHSELFDFCRCFLPIVFDGVYEGSINEALCQTLIREKSDQKPEAIWRALADYAGECSQTASTVTKDNINPIILEMFGIEPKDSTQLTATISNPERMAKLVLIGAWDEKNAADRSAIERITGESYPVFLEYAREQLNAKDATVALNNGIWRVSNRKKIISKIRHFFFDDLVQRAFDVATDIVSEVSKRFSDDGSIRYYMPESGWFTNSSVFRKRLCEGLCILKNVEQPKHMTARLMDRLSLGLVRHFFRSNSWKTFASADDLLPILAELSPDTFLDEVEDLAVSRKGDLRELFPKKGQQSLLDPNFITQVLWAIERLAWMPQYFAKSIRCLGCIEMIGYEETNHANTPCNSLVSIMNVYSPQTFASVQQIRNAILALKYDSPDLCWAVLLKLLPTSSATIITTSKPRCIDMGQLSNILSENDRYNLITFCFEMALQLSGESADRISSLADYTWNMSDQMVTEYLELAKGSSLSWTNEQKYQVWDSLQSLRAQIIIDNDEQKPDSKAFTLLEQAIGATRPTSKWFQYLRLYTKGIHEDLIDGIATNWKNREVEKAAAILDIYLSDGIESVISFGERAGNIHDVGWKLGTKLGIEQFSDVISRYSEETDSQFYASVVGGYLQINGVNSLLKIGIEDYDAVFRATVLLSAPLQPETFSMAESILPDKTMYWKQIKCSWFPPEWTKQTTEIAVNELMHAGRFKLLAHAIGFAIIDYDLPDELLKTILLGAASEQSVEKLDSYAVQKLIQQLQSAKEPDIDTLVRIEYLYLPILGEHSQVQPKALYYKLSNESRFFCEMMELAYMPRHGDHKERHLGEGVAQRLYALIYDYRVVPGVDWDGTFSPNLFQTWIEEVVSWAQETDRLTVVQQTIGNGLSFAPTEDGLPNNIILEELNKPQNREMRHGYELGIQNQRGVHWVDPEGKPEKALAKKYADCAEKVESYGFSRAADMFREISKAYLQEAEENKKEHSLMLEEEEL